jgi:hypothetical protein
LNYLAADLNGFRKIQKDFQIQIKVWAFSEIRIWTLVLLFKSKNFEIQTKDNLDSNKEFKSRIWKIDSMRVWGPNDLGIFPKISYAFLEFLGMKMNDIWVNFGAIGHRNIPK